MAASQFIALLESRGLLDPEIIVELHRQVEQSKVRVTPEAIAKLLVENGQLTRFQATKLVTELNESLGSNKPDPSIALRGGRPLEEVPVNDHDSVDDLLPPDIVEVEDVVESVEVIEDEVPMVDVPPSRKSSRQKKIPSELDDLPIRVVRGPNVKKKSAWESFRIIGYGFLVLMLIIIFIPLAGWFLKGSADDAFLQAENAYKSQDYDRASKGFADFAKNFSGDERMSQSKVFSALARVRQDAEKIADPTVALKSCQDILPSITSEAALGQLRGDVTDVLLRIAEKFVVKTENTASVAERKILIEKMNQQMELIRDPRYVGTLERTQNELRIKTIEENQSRLVRDIQRGEDLSATISEMKKSVESRNVSATYDLRKKLLRKYPQLETEAVLSELLGKATSQQQELVVSSTQLPTLSNEPEATNRIPSALLVGRKANANELQGSTVFLRAKGSVWAMNVASGQPLWRKYIGLDWSGEPLRLMQTADSDVLVSIPEQGKLRRLAATDGTQVWEAKLPGRIHSPSIDGDDIFVTTTSGEVFCLDVATGQSRWGKKLPQSIDVGVGGATDKKKRYVLGNHSNLYVMSRASGKCEEVEYVGHSAATIAVPPIWIQNQLILFENEGPDYCRMRLFQTNDEGLDIQPSPSTIRFRGHVIVPPQVDRRRLAVVTNLGEVAILEVDALNPKERVFKHVNLVENETVPKLTWPLMIGNELLLASTRLTLYQVPSTSQKLNRQWSKDEGDQFTAKPINADEFVVHTRVVRGNLGVRVTAITLKTGDVAWETDIGVPVTSVTSDGKGGFLAITSQAAAYSLDDKSFSSGKPVSQTENLGRNQRTMMFTSPVTLPDSRVAILNQAQGNQMLLADPKRRSTTPTKMLPLDFGDAFPSSEPIAIGSGSVLVPLNNGQIALLDPDKGKLIGSPFQPDVQAGERPNWLNPVLLSDKQTVIVADQKRSMYKLSTGKQLRRITSQTLEKALKGRLSVIQDVIVGVSASASGDQLDFYDSIELKLFTSVPVEGRFTWGPYVLAGESKNYLLALSDIEGLIACDETGKRLWTKTLEKTVLVGAPTLLESDGLLATTSGELIRVAMASGDVLAKTQLGEPISGPPIVLGKGLVVPGDEGIVLTVPFPTVASENAGANR